MFSQQPVVPAQWNLYDHVQILLKGNGDVLLQNIATGDARTIHADLPVVDISYNLRFPCGYSAGTLLPVVMLGGELRYLYVYPDANALEEARVIPHNEALQLSGGRFPLPTKIRHVKRLAKAFSSGVLRSSFLYIDSDDNLNYTVNVTGVGLVTTQLADVADFYVYSYACETSSADWSSNENDWPSFYGVAVKTDGSVMSILCTRAQGKHVTTPVIQSNKTYYPCGFFSAVSDIKLMRLGNNGSRAFLLAVGTSGAAEICLISTGNDGNFSPDSIGNIYEINNNWLRLHLCDTGFEWLCTAPASFGRLVVWKSAGEVQYRVLLETKDYDEVKAKGSWFRELTMDEGKEAGTLGIAQRTESSAC